MSIKIVTDIVDRERNSEHLSFGGIILILFTQMQDPCYT